MALHISLSTGLVFTTVYVTVFGVVLAIHLHHEKDLISDTAAYAAVLVVFVRSNCS